ncbi:DUF2243 domain-containing protein [Arthrobacter sp.]|uniref:DUF2243 domain-containing protein n=1 Tax=Arthrobacter sp. TaxID=1667 RepID=UPI002810DB32|nr:DUF2243 domain-containing protein [Arthrobacter sp.]
MTEELASEGHGRPGGAPARRGGASAIRLPGILLGIGLGGFVDGIVLHQILQWHHMLSSADTANIPVGAHPVDTVEGLEMNTLWDGLFHSFTWLAVVVGLAMLYSRVAKAGVRVWASRVLWGWVLVGWGAFNLVEGVVNHHVLAIHHVISGPWQTVADLLFLLFGAILVLTGWLLQRSSPAGSAGRVSGAVPSDT